MSWPTVALGDVCITGSGGTPSRSNGAYYGGGIPWVKSGELLSDVITSTEETISEEGLKKSSAKLLEPGCILLAMYGASIGKTATLGIRAATNQAVCNIRPKDDRISADFIRIFLEYSKPSLIRRGAGGAQPNISQNIIRDTEIPLPPLEEQRRIAGILDAADALHRRRREALALLDTLPGAIFAEMFGALTTSDRFPRGPLSDLIRGFDTGKNLAPASDEEGARHRVLKVSAVTKGEFIEAESKPLPADYSPPASHFVKPGDLLFSRANTSALIGATAMVENVSDNIVLPDKIWRFILDPEKAEPTFLHYLFSTRKFRDEVSRRATGSSGSMKNISKAKVLSIEVGQPPIEMQRDFTRKVRICRDLRAKVSGHLAELEVIFASLQSRAFAGEL